MLVGWYFSENQKSMESRIVDRYILQKCFYQNELSGDVELHLFIFPILIQELRDKTRVTCK